VLVAHTCNPSYSGGRDQEAIPEEKARHYLKNTQHKKRAGRVTVKSLPSKHEALSSNPSTTEKKERIHIDYP
jgi:hypothetical protein